MRVAQNPVLKQRLSHCLKSLPDYYQDFDICTWVSAEDEQEVMAIIDFVGEYPEATTVDVINFQEWVADQREDGRL